MVSLRKAYPEDFDSVYPFLKEHFKNPSISKEDFQQLFIKRWRSIEEHCGFLLEDYGKPVGYLGALYSLRPVGDRMEKFCNLAAWYVRPAYRSSSLSLLLALLSQKDTTFTNLTASNRVVEVLRKLGFKDLETKIWFIPPVGIPFLHKGFQFETKPECIGAFLSSPVKTVFNDHLTMKCLHGLINWEGQICYLNASMTIKKRLPVIALNYISNIPFFFDHANQISIALCKKWHGFALMAGDHYFPNRKPGFSISVHRKHPLLFRSSRVQPYEMDLLYSEIPLLGLTPV